MGKIAETAKERFLGGSSCSQSMFSSFAEYYGVDKEVAYRIASGFGGGVAHTGGLCGAVTGGLMALGLKYGKPRAMTPEEKSVLDAKAHEFMRRYKEKHNAIECKHLLGYNVGVPEEKAECMAKGVIKKRCPHFIQYAAEQLEELMEIPQ